ncbi:MAG: acyl-CoA dehydrogenase family protein [Tepidisphaeraceae bacterium]
MGQLGVFYGRKNPRIAIRGLSGLKLNHCFLAGLLAMRVDPADNFAIVKTESIYPLAFSDRRQSGATEIYLSDPSIKKLAEFFERKGLAAIKAEDRGEQWCEDWIAYQAAHHLYASVLSPQAYSTLGYKFDLLRLTRLLEVFAYFSPGHGYSLQVTFLGLFSILMGKNSDLKREAVAALESGALLAFGVSEKNHGSDLIANEFTVERIGPGRLLANGGKYYIGNANAAALISMLARMEDRGRAGRGKRAPPVMFVLRTGESKGFGPVRKIQTLGIRAAFVGEFEVKNHELPEGDLIAEGRDAWDAVLGTVTLGKFFLGFGSIGICERAFEEAITHVTQRVLYGKPVIDMPHIGSAVAQAYARLTAMKLYAYRALDYVQSSSAADRRYQLFAAVQKAKVSTEGVKVMALLCECVGAKGFEADTYFEMALRDVQLIPGLEGSMHVNLGLAAQFAGKYFGDFDPRLAAPKSLIAGGAAAEENTYLFEARAVVINTVAFGDFLSAYAPLKSVANVRLFARQSKAFSVWVRSHPPSHAMGTSIELSIGQCLATIAYAQLIAENAVHFDVPPEMISVIFHLLVNDLSGAALSLACCRGLDRATRRLIRRVVFIPKTTDAEWDFVLQRARAGGVKPPV